eukprot:TRINITY_DN779894_c0_g1_i1.p1 TRINITY_DN779894_c0_g1~~TRINITY_DN779894_c0_g1_i1.p1  ORF type:complete len:999 (+),score=127.09 TRINITY_DN779894_c0_g1_i1:90-3086(+)
MEFSNLNDFVEFILEMVATDGFSLKEFFQTLESSKNDDFWNNLKRIAKDTISKKHLLQQGRNDSNVGLFDRLQAISIILDAYLTENEGNFASFNEIYEIALDLSDVIVVLDEGDLQQRIVKIAEQWYLKKYDGYQLFIGPLLPYLLVKSLAHSASEKDIKRVNDIKDGLLLLDFEDCASIETLQDLLFQTVISPLYLKCSYGINFISFLFEVNERLARLVHETIRNQLSVVGQKKGVVAQAYGSIFLKAWRSANVLGDETNLSLMEGFLQDFIHAAVHCRNDRLFTTLRNLLNVFNESKKSPGVDELLLRLLNPILWRALSAANSVVRRQAAILFVDAFPLQSSKLNRSEIVQLLDKQYNYLVELLDDHVVGVRVIAIEGAYRVLGLFWKLCPNEKAEVLLDRLMDSALDQTSASIRRAVVKGVIFLIRDEPLAFDALQQKLLRLRPLIHDPSQAVRIRLIELLLVISRMKRLLFHDIVSLDELMARLATDCSRPNVAHGLVRLLQPSFLPLDESGSSQFSKLTILIGKYPMAAQAFFLYLPFCISMEDSCKIFKLLHRGVVLAGKSDLKKLRKRKRETKSLLSLKDESIILGLVGGMLQLLNTLQPQLIKREHKDACEYTVQEMNSNALLHLLEIFGDGPNKLIVFHLIGLILSITPTNKKLVNALLGVLDSAPSHSNTSNTLLDCFANCKLDRMLLIRIHKDISENREVEKALSWLEHLLEFNCGNCHEILFDDQELSRQLLLVLVKFRDNILNNEEDANAALGTFLCLRVSILLQCGRDKDLILPTLLSSFTQQTIIDIDNGKLSENFMLRDFLPSLLKLWSDVYSLNCCCPESRSQVSNLLIAILEGCAVSLDNMNIVLKLLSQLAEGDSSVTVITACNLLLSHPNRVKIFNINKTLFKEMLGVFPMNTDVKLIRDFLSELDCSNQKVFAEAVANAPLFSLLLDQQRQLVTSKTFLENPVEGDVEVLRLLINACKEEKMKLVLFSNFKKYFLDE